MNRADGRQNGSASLLSIPGPWRGQVQTHRAIAVAVMLAAAAAAGVAAAIDPVILSVACVATVGTVAIASPAARFAIVVGGGLLVFRSSDQLDPFKSAYLVWVGISATVAMARVAAEREYRHLAIPLLLASAAVVAAIALSLVVALVSETPFIDWMRDAAPYGLLAVSPFLAWDGARSRLGSHMEAIAVAAGLMASVSFAVEWLGRRGLADLPFATFGSGGTALPALAFAVATASILSRRPWLFLWVTVAAAVFTLLLMTGTRSALVLLVAPLAMAVANGQRFTISARLAGAILAVGVAGLALAFVAFQVGLVDVSRLGERLGSIVRLGSALSDDPSYIERAMQVSVASAAFATAPVVGVGLGFRFEWEHLGGQFVPSYAIDTGLSIVAKFGVIGLGLFGIATAAGLSFYRRLRLRLPGQVRLSFVGFAAVSIAMLPLGNPLEDKGFGLAVAILVARALASARAACPDPDPVAEIRAHVPGSPQIRTAARRVPST